MEHSSKPTWKENRTLAALVLCVVVLLSVFGIGAGKVQKLGNDLNAMYSDTMEGDWRLRLAAADSLLQAGQVALAATDPALQGAQQALQAAHTAVGPAQQFAANTVLQTQMGLLYETLRVQLTDEKGGVLQTQWSEFLSRGNIMANGAQSYNEQARAVQKKLRGFPASVLASLTNIEISEFSA